MENHTHSFRKANLVLQIKQESQIKWNCDELELTKEKNGYFCTAYFWLKEFFLAFVFYLNV